MPKTPTVTTALSPLDSTALNPTPASVQAAADAWLASMGLTSGVTDAQEFFAALDKAQGYTPAATPTFNVQNVTGPYADFFNGSPLTLKNGRTITPQVARYLSPTNSFDAGSAYGGVVLPGMSAPVSVPVTSGALNDVNMKYIPGTDLYNNTVNFLTNAVSNGNGGMVPDKDYFTSTPYGVTYTPGTSYRLVNPATGQVYGTADDVATLRALSAQGLDLANNEGTAANYALQSSLNGSDWSNAGVAYHYDPVTLGDAALQFGSMALPVIGGVVAAPLGLGALGLGATGTAALGSALGATTAGVLRGQSVGDILKAAALAGLGSYAGGELLGSLGKGLAPAATKAGSGAGALASAVEPNIINVIAPSALSNLGSAVGGLASLANSVPQYEFNPSQAVDRGPLGQVASSDPYANPIVATGTKTLDLPAFAVPAISTTGYTPPATELTTTPEGNIVVKATPKAEQVGSGIGSLAANISSYTPPQTELTTTPEGEIVVRHSKASDLAVPTPGITTSTPDIALNSSGEPSITVTGQRTTTPEELAAITGLTIPEATNVVNDTTPVTQPKSTLSKIADALQIGGLATGLLGGAASGSSGTGAKIPAGLFGSSSGTGGTLPAPNLPGLTGAGATPKSAADLGMTSPLDWYRYGYGPERNFFSSAPQNIPASTAYTGYEGPLNTTPSKAMTGFAEGGSAHGGYPEHRSSFAVGGPGDGRDDKIPAMLSDGEYVMDAETVAMLGNGSNKAGAKALDRFRVNIRKQKGRELAKGSISADAKQPEAYLQKGHK